MFVVVLVPVPHNYPTFVNSVHWYSYLYICPRRVERVVAVVRRNRYHTHALFTGLNLVNPMTEYTFSGPSYTTTTSSARPHTTPMNSGIRPNLLSTGNMSSGSMQLGGTRRGSGTHSPSLAAIPRSHRYNPIAISPRITHSAMARKRRAAKQEDFSDDNDDFAPIPSFPSSGSNKVALSRCEEIRRQRIELEQRRRDELRDGYRCLKDVLPVSNQKSSKVSLLHRATSDIKYLEMTQQQLQTRLQNAENETRRLQGVNEALMLNTAGQCAAMSEYIPPPPRARYTAQPVLKQLQPGRAKEKLVFWEDADVRRLLGAGFTEMYASPRFSIPGSCPRR
ncbi:hypothetical protein OF83DRAFT_1175632 [Amylostereum chailletii]|nr:hypothetical protein OF83DRAFT_1175632 [Amylostereum chailletii]